MTTWTERIQHTSSLRILDGSNASFLFVCVSACMYRAVELEPFASFICPLDWKMAMYRIELV